MLIGAAILWVRLRRRRRRRLCPPARLQVARPGHARRRGVRRQEGAEPRGRRPRRHPPAGRRRGRLEDPPGAPGRRRLHDLGHARIRKLPKPAADDGVADRPGHRHGRRRPARRDLAPPGRGRRAGRLPAGRQEPGAPGMMNQPMMMFDQFGQQLGPPAQAPPAHLPGAGGVDPPGDRPRGRRAPLPGPRRPRRRRPRGRPLAPSAPATSPGSSCSPRTGAAASRSRSSSNP